MEAGERGREKEENETLEEVVAEEEEESVSDGV